MKTNDYDDIANLYDIYVPAEYDIPFFLSEALKISGPVLELMAGTGRVSLPLIEAGVNLTCVDNSPEMLAILEEKLKTRGLKASLIPLDICQLDLPGKFNAALIPFNSFAHLISVEQQKEAMQRIVRHLSPEGIFIFTLSNPVIRQRHIDGQMHLFRKYPLPQTGGSLLFWISENFSADEPHRVETLEFFEEYDQHGELVRKRVMELQFRLSEQEEIESLLKSAGFEISAFYGDYSYNVFNKETSQHMIWKCLLR